MHPDDVTALIADNSGCGSDSLELETELGSWEAEDIKVRLAKVDTFTRANYDCNSEILDFNRM
jgi:hypothetical protein